MHFITQKISFPFFPFFLIKRISCFTIDKNCRVLKSDLLIESDVFRNQLHPWIMSKNELFDPLLLVKRRNSQILGSRHHLWTKSSQKTSNLIVLNSIGSCNGFFFQPFKSNRIQEQFCRVQIPLIIWVEFN